MRNQQYSDICVPVGFALQAEEMAWVKEGEEAFARRFSDLAARIDAECDKVDMMFLALCGPTCSGKTTAAARLTSELAEVGRTVHLISLDDFYLERSLLHERAERTGKPLDYDSVDTLDLACLAECVSDLGSKGEALFPVFDFHSGTRTEYRRLTADPSHKNVYIFEGIQALYPEVSAILQTCGRDGDAGPAHRSLFISVQRGIQVGAQRFAPHEIRLMRRLVRDSVRRSAATQFTLSLWESVRQNEMRSILPYEATCDFVVDSTMPYDVHMLLSHLRPLLATVPADCKEYETACALLERLEGISPVSDAYLEPNSLYREFL